MIRFESFHSSFDLSDAVEKLNKWLGNHPDAEIIRWHQVIHRQSDYCQSEYYITIEYKTNPQ